MDISGGQGTNKSQRILISVKTQTDLPLKYSEGCISSFGSLLILCSTLEDRRWSPHTVLLPILDLGPTLHVFHNLKTLKIKL